MKGRIQNMKGRIPECGFQNAGFRRGIEVKKNQWTGLDAGKWNGPIPSLWASRNLLPLLEMFSKLPISYLFHHIEIDEGFQIPLKVI